MNRLLVLLALLPAFALANDAKPASANAAEIAAATTIEAELKAGKLKMTRQPTAGYRCLGPIADYDAAGNTYKPPIECRQSVHFPYRTAAELGLLDESQISPAQTRTLPYVMSSGKYWAHVMIEHPDPVPTP